MTARVPLASKARLSKKKRIDFHFWLRRLRPVSFEAGVLGNRVISDIGKLLVVN